jgi:hypothetical protein
MRCNTRGTGVDPTGDWAYTETIDEEESAIRVRGRVDRLSVDLLCGTIEELHRRGHSDIAVTIERSGSVDPCARAALVEIAGRLARRRGRLTVMWADATGSLDDGAPEVEPPDVLIVSGRPRTDQPSSPATGWPR